jgi:signal transduction histidine kinase
MRAVVLRVLRAPVTARTWREYTYAVVALVFAVPTFLLALLGVVASAGTLVMVGLPVLVGVLVTARGTVRWFRIPARAILGWDWPSPPPLPRGRGTVQWFVAVLGDGVAWRALLYAFVKFPLITAAAYLGGVLVFGGTLFLTFPLWWFVAPDGFRLLDSVSWAGTLGPAIEGAAAVLVFPWLVRLLVGLDRLLVRALLAPSGDRARIAALESSRTVLTADAAETLRRVERDLHDGTQARLVSLGVTLSRIGRRVDDPVLAGLVASARATVTDALTELRDIVRRIHPPALDAGLATALETLAARSAVPVSLSVSLPASPSASTATAVYFAVAELLTNVARHASATRVQVQVGTDGGWLRLTVRDDGRGGAVPSLGAGSGLAGLVRRAQALDGSVAIDSPVGGPTVVTMTLRRD